MKTIRLFFDSVGWKWLLAGFLVNAAAAGGFYLFVLKPSFDEKTLTQKGERELQESLIIISGAGIEQMLSSFQEREKYFEENALSRLDRLPLNDGREIRETLLTRAEAAGLTLLELKEGKRTTSGSGKYDLREIGIKMEGRYKNFLKFISAEDDNYPPFVIKDLTVAKPDGKSAATVQTLRLLIGVRNGDAQESD